jgi:hypothetical protein
MADFVDVYVSAKELETKKPFLTQVVFAGIVDLGGKKFISFRKPDPTGDACLLDATVIMAVRRKGPATPPVTPASVH